MPKQIIIIYSNSEIGNRLVNLVTYFHFPFGIDLKSQTQKLTQIYWFLSPTHNIKKYWTESYNYIFGLRHNLQVLVIDFVALESKVDY